MAVSQFAPGSQLVKDKAVHTAVGVANWEPRPGRVVEVDNPLGPPEPVDYCRSCLHLRPANGANGSTASEICPTCGEMEGFRRLDFREPLGFRTDFRPRDYDGSFDYAAGTGSSRIVPLETDQPHEAEHARIEAGRGTVYAVNDNGGQLWTFGKAPGWPGWLSVDVAEGGVSRYAVSMPDEIPEEGRLQVALGAKYMTDMALVTITQEPIGFNLDPISLIGRRAAWYSLGFLLREAAVRHLDVEARELRVGLHYQPTQEGRVKASIYLADGLENGAGYSTHIARPEIFAQLLNEAKGYVDELEQASHASQCDSSCYDCLREYQNMSYHPLLDWRLARDLLALMLKQEPKVADWLVTETHLAGFLAREADGEAVELPGERRGVRVGNEMLVIAHPLEEHSKHAATSERLVEAVVAAEDSTGREAKVFDSFLLLRRSGPIVSELLALR